MTSLTKTEWLIPSRTHCTHFLYNMSLIMSACLNNCHTAVPLQNKLISVFLFTIEKTYIAYVLTSLQRGVGGAM